MKYIPDWALEASIKGGYDKTYAEGIKVMSMEPWRYFVTDPSFFQCLGKELGWDKRIKSIYHSRSGGKSGNHFDGDVHLHNSWPQYAHRLYDLILSRATDEEIAAYWDSLKPKV